LVQVQIIPPQLRVWHEDSSSQTYSVPSHHPVASASPHPRHVPPTTITSASQVSAQAAAEVEHPAVFEHTAWQQPPAVHRVGSYPQTQVAQLPDPSHSRSQDAG
jgi:hypothetical protein